MTHPVQMMTQDEHRDILPLGEALQTYIDDGFRQEGSFLSAIIEGNLIHSALFADNVNKELLFEYALYMNYFAPDDSRGSKWNHENWVGLNNLK